MKGIIANIFIVLLIVANIVVGMANYEARKPKCFCDGCNKARVSGSRYCSEHENSLNERTLCLEVTNRN